MPSFQRQLWEERAWARYERQRSKDPAAEPKARGRLDEDMVAISGLDVVISWAARRGITVAFSSLREAGVFSSEEKTIFINSTQRYENQLFILLHECGHILVGSEKSGAHHRFKLGYPATYDPGLKDKFIHRCAILEEEFEAWHRGRRLAKKLEIEINDERWSTLKASMLKSYIKWSLKHQDFEDHP